jgi:hypothetical protein
LRPAYPFSVIPGGIYSRAELAIQAARDNLVREHYAGFRMESTQLAVLQDDLLAYVSYRKNNSIFWTRKQLRIPKGELILSDGTHLARARCGNRLSETPVEPTAAQPEPTPDLTIGPLTLASLRDPRIAFVPPPELPGSTIKTLPNAFLTAGESAATPSFPGTASGRLMPPATAVLPIAVLPVPFPSAPSSTGSTTGVSPVLIPPSRPLNAVPEPAHLVIAGLALVTGMYSLWQRRKTRK